MRTTLERKGRNRSLIYLSTALRSAKLKPLSIITIFIYALISAAPSAFADPPLTLDDAIQRGLEHSFDLKSSRSSFEAAKYGYSASRAESYPTISLNASGFYIDRLVNVDAFPGGIELGSHENYLADFRLSMPLYTGGRLGGSIGTKRAILKAAESEVKSSEMNVAYQCRLAWLNLNLTNRLVKSAEASLDRIHIIKEDILYLYQSGLADSVDIFEAELASENGLELLLKAKNGNRTASIKLGSLIGITNNEDIAAEEMNIDPQVDYARYDSIEIDVDNLSRPELSVIKNQIEAAKYVIHLNKASYLPSIVGFAGYSVGKPNRDMFNGDWDNYFSTGLTLNWQFNIGGKTGSQINVANAQYRSSEMKLNEVEERMVESAETSMGNLTLAYKLYLSSKKKYDITKNRFRLASEKMKAGSLSSNRLLEMEAELSSAEQDFYASQLEFYINESHFLYAIGSDKIYRGF